MTCLICLEFDDSCRTSSNYIEDFLQHEDLRALKVIVVQSESRLSIMHCKHIIRLIVLSNRLDIC